MLEHGSTFAGIGGFDLAAEWMGWNNQFHCEWNEFGRQVLKYYWPNAKSYNDITKSDFTIHQGRLDVFTGGFPCQGFSLAGLRMGTEDNRFLWPEMRRAYNESKPAWIVGENVTGITTMVDQREVSKDVFFKVEDRKITRLLSVDDYEAIYTRQSKMLVESICEDLEQDGYEVYPIVIPAASVEAPHRRERIWFLAYSHSRAKGSSRTSGKAESVRGENIIKPEGGGRKAEQYIGRGNVLRNDADTGGQGRGTRDKQRGENEEEFGGRETSISGTIAEFFSGPSGWRKFPTQSPVCSGNDGLSARLDGITFSKWRKESIKAYGNAIVPQVAFEIFKGIEQVTNGDII